MRIFWPVALPLVCACDRGAEKVTPMVLKKVSPESLLVGVPESLLTVEADVPREQNGWPLAFEAASAKTESVQGWTDLLGDPLSDPAKLERAAVVMRAYAPRLAILDRSLTKPRWQQTTAAAAFPQIAGLKSLVQVVVLRGQVLLAEGKPGAAMTEFVKARSIGKRVCDSRGVVISSLTGNSMRSVANRAIQRAAWHPKMSAEVLRRTLKFNISEGARTDGAFGRALALDLRESLVKELAALEGPVLTPGGKDLHDRVLAGHPHVFDRAETVRMAASAVEIAMANTERPWSQQVDLEPIYASWTPGFPLAEAYDDDAKPVSEETVTRYRNAALKVTNPFGRFYAAINVSTFTTTVRSSFMIRADDSATRAILGLALWAKRHGGALPTTLPEPVRDPFSDESLHYDAARGILWSVGSDAKDDHGDGNPRRPYFSKDRVWNVRGVGPVPTTPQS